MSSPLLNIKAKQKRDILSSQLPVSLELSEICALANLQRELHFFISDSSPPFPLIRAKRVISKEPYKNVYREDSFLALTGSLGRSDFSISLVLEDFISDYFCHMSDLTSTAITNTLNLNQWKYTDFQ